MRIVVCVKQVPEVSQIRFDNQTRRLVREGVTNVVNPFDRRAVTQAVLLRERFGGEVTVLTMGPPQAREALVECLAMGADRAVHLCDPAFAGSDTLATARALALAVRRLGFDIVLCGRNSVDAETGQVGPEVAELLDIAHVTGLCELDVAEDASSLVARRETDDGFQTLALPLPCLLTAAERLVRPIRPTPDDRATAGDKPLERWTAADLSDEPSLFGQAGSPTSVADIRYVQPQRDRIVVGGDDPQATVRQLIDYLLARGVFSPRAEPARAAPHPGGRRDGAPRRAVWVVAETSGGHLRPVTLELLGRGAALAEALGGPLQAVLIGEGGAHHLPTLAAHGADAVLLAEDASLTPYTAEAWTGLLAAAIGAHRPHTVLVPSTAQGRDFAPRLAARLGLGLTGDCIGLEVDEQGRLVQMKPAFGGNIVAPILSRTFPQIATVRPGMLSTRPPDRSRRATVVALPAATTPPRVRVLSEELDPEASDSTLESAEAVVCAGTGIGGPENLPPLRALAAALGGALGASRRVVDNGWLPRQLQIGLTGKAIAPRLYVGVGVRGAFNHTVGIQKVEVIVAINSDPEAEVFQSADFGIVGDFAAVVPVLTEAAREARRRASAAK